MSTDFDGPDLFAGEIRAVRTFDLRSDGSLWPVVHADRPWAPGVNEAQCRIHRPAGAAGCRCGYWAYGTPRALRDQFAARNVAAVISCWGRATPGTRGLRAQFARIEALWLSRRVPAGLRLRVADAYPGVPIFDDRDAMLATYPPTVLPSYRLPGRPRATVRLARGLVLAMIAATLLLGVLPRDVLTVGWVAAARDEVLRMVVYTVLYGVAMWGYWQVVHRRASPFGRVAMIGAVLGAWVLAPLETFGWQVLLRAPLLLGLIPYVLRRATRFVPTPAGPPARPPAGSPPGERPGERA